MEKNLIRKAGLIVGSMAELGRALGVSKAAVHQWAEGISDVPAKYCASIEILTKGEISRLQLRPKDGHLIWPELASTQPPNQKENPALR